MNLTENMLASDSFRQTCRGLGWNLNQRNEDRVEIPACHVCSHAAHTVQILLLSSSELGSNGTFTAVQRIGLEGCSSGKGGLKGVSS